MIISRAYLDPGDDATLSNVLFGDVYVCGGQSNMQFTVSSVFNATKEIAVCTPLLSGFVPFCFLA